MALNEQNNVKKKHPASTLTFQEICQLYENVKIGNPLKAIYN